MQPRKSSPQYIVQGAGVSTPYAPTIIMDWLVDIKCLIKAYVPRQQQRSVRIAINDIKRRVLSLGWSVECPICAGTFGQFLRFGNRRNEWCPQCRSLGRHRLIYLYLNYNTPIFLGREHITVLHFGPEFSLVPVFSRIPRLTYVTADAMVSLVDFLGVKPKVCTSIAEVCLPSASCDLVVCSHVLNARTTCWRKRGLRRKSTALATNI